VKPNRRRIGGNQPVSASLPQKTKAFFAPRPAIGLIMPSPKIFYQETEQARHNGKLLWIYDFSSWILSGMIQAGFPYPLLANY